MSLPPHTALSVDSEVGEAGPSTPTSSSPPNEPKSRTRKETKTKAKTTENKLKTTKARTKPIPRPIQAFSDPSVGEEETVHEIYESIAPHFALTRHKPWPLITSFLSSLPPNSLGLDSGAGNGKYLPTAHSLGHTMIAMDRSLGLLGIAKEQDGAGDVVRGDLGGRGWRDGVFRNLYFLSIDYKSREGQRNSLDARAETDYLARQTDHEMILPPWEHTDDQDFTISVAAIHHLSTPTRRRQAVQAILPTLSQNRKAPYSRFFIYVWAYEQGGMSKREMGTAANASKEHEHEQKHKQGEKQEQKHEQEAEGQGQTEEFEFGSGSVPGDPNIHRTGTGVGKRERVQDVLVPWVLKSNSTNSKRKTKSSSSSSSKPTPQSKPTIDGTQTSQSTATNTDAGEVPEGEKEEEEKVYHRYYHLFVQGELRELIHEAGREEGYRIIPSTPPPPSSSVSESLSNSDIPLSSLSISPSTTSSIPTMTKTTSLEAELGRDEKWLRIRGEGWEADNWWVEAEVGVGAIVDY